MQAILLATVTTILGMYSNTFIHWRLLDIFRIWIPEPRHLSCLKKNVPHKSCYLGIMP